MKKFIYRQRKIIIIIGILLLFVIIFLSINYIKKCYISEKSIWDSFLGKNQILSDSKLCVNNGQKYTIDEYEITLEQTIYDSQTQIGYCLFSITKENGKTEANLNAFGDSEYNSFGNDNRFKIHLQINGGQTQKFQYKEKTLYTLISFTTDDDNISLYLVDGDSDIEHLDNRYYFNIEKTYQSYEYIADNSTKLYLSPLGIKIVSNKTIENHRIELNYLNGTKKIIIDTEKSTGIYHYNFSESAVNTEKTYQFVFPKGKKLDKVNSIYYNGKQLIKSKTE